MHGTYVLLQLRSFGTRAVLRARRSQQTRSLRLVSADAAERQQGGDHDSCPAMITG